MARTPYSDPKAEAAYQDMVDNSSKPSADDASDLTDPNGQDQKNNMLRTMSVRSTLGLAQKLRKSP